MSRGLLIFNSKAGKQDENLIPAIIQSLENVEAISLDDLGPDNDAYGKALAGGFSWVAAAGGDGTIECVASKLAGKNLPLGIIPIGTFNNFARSLNIPLDPLDACKVILTGDVRKIDVGFANGKAFFETLGAGLDAALYPLGEEIKSGQLLRWIDFMKRAYRYRRQTFQLTLDRPIDEALRLPAMNESRHLIRALSRRKKNDILLSALMLSVSNGPYFGMNFAVAPEQRMDDGHLTVTVFSRYSKLQLWWHFFSIAFGRRNYAPKSIAFRVRKLTISGPRKLPVHLDGTPEEGFWPVDIECRAGDLCIFSPARPTG